MLSFSRLYRIEECLINKYEMETLTTVQSFVPQRGKKKKRETVNLTLLAP